MSDYVFWTKALIYFIAGAVILHGVSKLFGLAAVELTAGALIIYAMSGK